MSENLIGFGCDLQQKLDAMKPELRRARWAGYVAVELYGIAQRLQVLNEKARTGRPTSPDKRAGKRLLVQARSAVQELGAGIRVFRQSDPAGWPLYVVFPGDVPEGSGQEAYIEQGVAVPPRP